MSHRTIGVRRWPVWLFGMALFSVLTPSPAAAQGFISPSFGYNFGGDSGCPTATDCENKNWNLGVSLGTFGTIFGFEAELTYENDFFGKDPNASTGVLTLMGNLMLAPKISIVRPYGLAGLGLIRTSFDDKLANETTTNNQFGWTLGGGLVVYVNPHVGLKGDIRHYHAFENLEILGIDLTPEQNKLDFGRAAFGVVLSF